MKLLPSALVLSLTLAAPVLADDSPADIWQAKCKGCHGAAGNADTKIGHKEKIPDFTNPEFQKKTTDAEIKETITNGSETNSKMKPFKEKLSPSEIDGMVKYVRSLGSGSAGKSGGVR